MNIRTIQKLAVAGLLASALAACADPATVTAPKFDVANASPSILNNPPVGEANTANNFVEEDFLVCKAFSGSTLGYPTASFSAVITGTYNTTVNFTLTDGQCADLGDFGGTGVDVTVTETPIANYTTSYTTQTVSWVGGGRVYGSVSAPVAGNSASGSAYGGRAGANIGTKIVFQNAYVPPVGCTLTQGYWKTHSSYGPAPYDAAWTNVGGADASFFLSGQTWYQVFWTAPAGNAYYNLAHQYMAAKLNVLDGASYPANVGTAITDAEALFAAYTPAQVAALAKNSSVRAQFISLAGTLGSYNEGLIGPGHCGE